MYIFQKIGIKFTVDGFFENQPMPGMAYFSRTNAIPALQNRQVGSILNRDSGKAFSQGMEPPPCSSAVTVHP